MYDAAVPNRILEFYSGKTVLVTGASGFVGIVLIEKLLRTCSCSKIYVLFRNKHGKNVTQRLQEILRGPLFESVKKMHGEKIFDKVVGIPGDVGLEELGLSPEDRRRLTEETEIIYHAACIVKFEDSFKSTILTNVRGTKLMLELAKQCKKLLAFCHISTAFCHENQEIVFEKTYPRPDNPHRVIQLCELLEEDVLESTSKKLLGERSNNNYTFSKALGEALIEEVMDELPVIITRPSVVVPMWKEPVPGLTMNLNNMSGLLVGAGKGVIRTMYARKDILIDCYPVDVLANMLIVAVYDNYTYKTRRIYNATASEDAQLLGLTMQTVLDASKQQINKIAFSKILWYPNGTLKESRIAHNLSFFFFQLVPAVFVDAILLLVGVKPFLVRIQKRVWKSYRMFEYYGNRKWCFDKTNSNAARSLLNSTEKQMFQLTNDGFDIHDYLYQGALFVRRHFMKDRDEDILTDVKRVKMYKYLDVFCKLFFVVIVLYYFCKLVF